MDLRGSLEFLEKTAGESMGRFPIKLPGEIISRFGYNFDSPKGNLVATSAIKYTFNTFGKINAAALRTWGDASSSYFNRHL